MGRGCHCSSGCAHGFGAAWKVAVAFFSACVHPSKRPCLFPPPLLSGMSADKVGKYVKVRITSNWTARVHMQCAVWCPEVVEDPFHPGYLVRGHRQGNTLCMSVYMCVGGGAPGWVGCCALAKWDGSRCHGGQGVGGWGPGGARGIANILQKPWRTNTRVREFQGDFIGFWLKAHSWNVQCCVGGAGSPTTFEACNSHVARVSTGAQHHMGPAVRRGRQLRCHVCKNRGATVGCFQVRVHVWGGRLRF